MMQVTNENTSQLPYFPPVIKLTSHVEYKPTNYRKESNKTDCKRQESHVIIRVTPIESSILFQISSRY